MKVFNALILAAIAKAIDSNTYKYMEYMSRFGKSHVSIEEFNMRLANFQRTDAFIQEWNSDSTNTAVLGHNHFSDWTSDEKSKLSGTRFDATVRASLANVPKHQVNLSETIPTSLNWTAKGVVPAVGD